MGNWKRKWKAERGKRKWSSLQIIMLMATGAPRSRIAVYIVQIKSSSGLAIGDDHFQPHFLLCSWILYLPGLNTKSQTQCIISTMTVSHDEKQLTNSIQAPTRSVLQWMVPLLSGFNVDNHSKQVWLENWTCWILSQTIKYSSTRVASAYVHSM